MENKKEKKEKIKKIEINEKKEINEKNLIKEKNEKNLIKEINEKTKIKEKNLINEINEKKEIKEKFYDFFPNLNEMINYKYKEIYTKTPYSQKKKVVNYLYQLIKIKKEQNLAETIKIKNKLIKNKKIETKKLHKITNEVYITNLFNFHNRVNRNAFLISCFFNGIFFSLFSKKIIFFRKNFIFLFTTIPICFLVNRNMYLKNFDNLYPIFIEERDEFMVKEQNDKELLDKYGFKNY